MSQNLKSTEDCGAQQKLPHRRGASGVYRACLNICNLSENKPTLNCGRIFHCLLHSPPSLCLACSSESLALCCRHLTQVAQQSHTHCTFGAPPPCSSAGYAPRLPAGLTPFSTPVFVPGFQETGEALARRQSHRCSMHLMGTILLSLWDGEARSPQCSPAGCRNPQIK